MLSELSYLQTKLHTWRQYNFPDADATQQLLGIAEETGELSHAHLKSMQNIRTNENHEANARDAIGDLAIYMMGYCSYRGWDFMEIIQETANHVLKRDWIENSTDGTVDPFYCAREFGTSPREYRERCGEQCLHCKGLSDVGVDQTGV